MEYNSTIFDENAEFYGKVKPSWHDYYFLDFIKCHRNTKASLLDVGGGSGIFSSLVKNMDPCIEITVVEPSQVLLNKIPNTGLKKVRGSLPNNLCLDSDLRFDYIHLREVFHHIVGPTIRDSKDLTAKSLLALKRHLDDKGYIMIHELFYEGYVIPSLPRSLIFYLLSFQNSIQFRIPIKDFLMGLQVCFYTRDEFKLLLAACGYNIIDYRIEHWGNNWKKKALISKNWGRMMFIAKKKAL